MKKVFKIIGWLVVVLIVGLVGLVAYAKLALPDVGPAENMKIEYTADRVERGKYLANAVSACMDCHSKRDWTKFSGPLVEGTLGQGGEKFDRQFGFPGEYFSRNLTPKGIGRYTDGELYRVITTGVTKEGRAMFPVMPYPLYGKMDPEDIKSIIAYIRTLPAIENQVPESVSDFPMSVIINTIPQKATPSKRPDSTDKLAYGAYLVNAAACRECHTKDNHGQIIPEMMFQGGREFLLPGGATVRSSNITPDAQTGIGSWTEEAFVNRFKTYAAADYKPVAVEAGAFNSIMPWTMYGRMTPSDLGAIYAYLKSLPAKSNAVVKFSPAGLAKK